MNILDHAKDIAILVKKYNDQDLYQKIVDLRDEIFALREENLELKAKVKELTDAADVSAELERRGNTYQRIQKDGAETGPFCLTCWDYERKLVNLLRVGVGLAGIRCGRCDKPARAGS